MSFFAMSIPCVVWRIEPSGQCEVAKENDDRADDSKTASSASLQAEISCRSPSSLRKGRKIDGRIQQIRSDN
jgi:hypothetical protein